MQSLNLPSCSFHRIRFHLVYLDGGGGRETADRCFPSCAGLRCATRRPVLRRIPSADLPRLPFYLKPQSCAGLCCVSAPVRAAPSWGGWGPRLAASCAGLRSARRLDDVLDAIHRTTPLLLSTPASALPFYSCLRPLGTLLSFYLFDTPIATCAPPPECPSSSLYFYSHLFIPSLLLPRLPGFSLDSPSA